MKRVKSNENFVLEELDYKNLQKKCKEHNLKAVGDKISLQNRLSDYFKSLKLLDNNDTKQNNLEEGIIESLEDLSIEEVIKYERIEPKETIYTTLEIKPILQLGILVSNSLKERLKTKKELCINTIIKTFEKESQIIPEYKIKTRRKVILINAIITLFQDETKGKTQKDSFIILDELIEGGKETVKKYIDSTKVISKTKSK